MGEFFLSLQQQFSQSFIEGDRWLRYLKGLGTSCQVTLGALALGIILGILVAVVRTAHDQQRSHKNGLLGFFNAICKIYTTVIRGTPMMVQLLIMGFVFFAASRRLTLVAILTLGINSGAYVSEIIRGGIMSIDSGQFEAGRDRIAVQLFGRGIQAHADDAVGIVDATGADRDADFARAGCRQRGFAQLQGIVAAGLVDHDFAQAGHLVSVCGQAIQ